jgi:ketosteroid isomerase-like protein
VRVRPLENIDRPSWLALAGVGILTIAGIGATLLSSAGSPAADPSTPLGVVTSYIRAVQAGDASKAWALITPNVNQSVPGEPPRPVPTEDDFRQQVQSSRQPTSPRVRVLNVTQSADTATVQLEVSRASGNPLTGVSSQQVPVMLARQADGWKITSDPFPWQFQ